MTRAVRDLLNSGFSGQARRGDSLGVWTFNEELHTGLLALQQWSPESQKAITERVAGFIAGQKLEKRTRFDKVLPALERVVRNSPFITVVLVCMGDEEISGSPFDQRINEFFRTWHLKQPDEGTPFVIAWRGQNGRLVDCTMNPSPWPAELPALPKELMTPLPAARPVARVLPKPDSPKPATSPVPPLILSGKKHEKTATSTSEPASTNVAVQASANPTTSTVSPAVTPTEHALVASAPPVASVTQAQSTPVPEFKRKPAETQQQPTASIAKPAAAEPVSGAAQQVTSNEPAPSATASGPAPVAPVQAATVSQASGRVSPVFLLGAGSLVLIAAAGAFWVWRRRSRSGDELSLITESIDRDKKE